MFGLDNILIGANLHYVLVSGSGAEMGTLRAFSQWLFQHLLNIYPVHGC